MLVVTVTRRRVWQIGGLVLALLCLSAPAASASPTLISYDDFLRADTVGTLGTPLIGPAWSPLLGAGAAEGGINGDRLTAPGGTIYACQNLPATPVYLGVRFVFEASGQAIGMAIGSTPPTGALQVATASLLHYTFSDTGLGITIWQPGAPNVPVQQGSQGFYSLTIGREYELMVETVGTQIETTITDTATAQNMLTLYSSDPLIPSVRGPMVFWEPTSAQTAITQTFAYGDPSPSPIVAPPAPAPAPTAPSAPPAPAPAPTAPSAPPAPAPAPTAPSAPLAQSPQSTPSTTAAPSVAPPVAATAPGAPTVSSAKPPGRPSTVRRRRVNRRTYAHKVRPRHRLR